MQLLAVMLSILLLAFTNTMVSANPYTVRESLAEGYTLGVMGFHGDVAGHEITYNGTIQEVLAYAETKYPGITAALAARDDVPLADTAEVVTSNLAGRSAQDWYFGGEQDGKGHRYCGDGPSCPLCKDWGYATKERIEEGIKFLNKVTASCNTGGHTCVRISCSWHSGIYLCNDLDDHIELPCNWVSTFAQDIIDDEKCAFPLVEGGWKPYHKTDFKGQQWADKKPYNTYVAWSYC